MKVRIVIAEHQGSTPRGAGTVMYVDETGQQGTIGGGALEFQAVAQARAMLGPQGTRQLLSVPLGPALGQCCGGAVKLLLETVAKNEPDRDIYARPVVSGPIPDMPLVVQKLVREMRSGAVARQILLVDGWLIEPRIADKPPLWIYGAGHVGRALVQVLQGLPFAVTWIDTARDRFPAALPEGVDMLVAADPALAVKHAPNDAVHLVLTYSHALDLAICHAVLSRPFAHLGLIGSDTKRARFRKRLRAGGVDPARMQCPIGDRSLGKEPVAIALGVATELLHNRMEQDQKREVRA